MERKEMKEKIFYIERVVNLLKWMFGDEFKLDQVALSVEEWQTLVYSLREVLAMLKPREAQIVTARLGLNEPKKTLKEIGQELNLGRERIRQIEVKALRKLRFLAKSPHSVIYYLRRLVKPRERYTYQELQTEKLADKFLSIEELDEFVRRVRSIFRISDKGPL